jgi:hypothetical protein
VVGEEGAEDMLGDWNNMCKGREMCAQSPPASSTQQEANLEWKEGKEALDAVPRIFIQRSSWNPSKTW